MKKPKKEKKYLEKEELLDVIKKFKLNEKNLEINVIFTNSNFSRKQNYKGNILLTSNEDIAPTITSSLQYLKNEIKERSFEQYDLELSMDETVQIVESCKVINGKEIISEMKDIINDDKRILTQDTKLDALDFIVIQLYDNTLKKSMYFFEKYVHPTSKYKKTFKFTLNGKQAKPFKEEIVTINPIVDAILYEDNYYVLNRKSFNTIFNFKDVFNTIINENKIKIKESNLFVESEVFIEDCMQDGRYLPRLTKVILADGFKTVQKNKSKLPELKIQFGLTFNLTGDNRIEYTDKKEASGILNLLLDHFVISALTNNKMLAKAIEKYNV